MLGISAPRSPPGQDFRSPWIPQRKGQLNGSSYRCGASTYHGNSERDRTSKHHDRTHSEELERNVVGDILLKMMEGRRSNQEEAQRRCGKSYRGNRKASGNIGEDVRLS